jgi:hypothetical protein
MFKKQIFKPTIKNIAIGFLIFVIIKVALIEIKHYRLKTIVQRIEALSK